MKRFSQALNDKAVYAWTFLASSFYALQASAQVDVTQPIGVIEDARTAAQATTLDADNAQGAANQIAETLIVWAAPIGLFMALFGFYLLYKANQDESGRASKGVALTTIIIGGFTVVFSVVTFIVVEYLLGTKT